MATAIVPPMDPTPIPPAPAPGSTLDPEALAFYCRAMSSLEEAGVPFLVGGAYAYARYTGVVRHTKDFDVFLRRRDFERALQALAQDGCQVERNFPHWLGKAWCGEHFVDLIYSSGNGVARVDAGWFEHAVSDTVLGQPARLCPAEEMIWSKSFIMERERFDGADVCHLLRHTSRDLDWGRLLARFGDNWPVLYAHLALFSFIYPGERDALPRQVMDELGQRQLALPDTSIADDDRKLCRGTLVSRSQYLYDVEQEGYRDARLKPLGSMEEEEVELWTEAAREDEAKHQGG
jgi:hypothetical protein